MPHTASLRTHSDRIVGGLIVGLAPGLASPAATPDHHAHLYISGPESLERTCTGPIQVRVTAPRGYTQELVARDEGFGHGYEVSLDTREPEGDDPALRVEVLVPAAESVPIEVEVIRDVVIGTDLLSVRHGHSNRRTTLEGPAFA